MYEIHTFQVKRLLSIFNLFNTTHSIEYMHIHEIRTCKPAALNGGIHEHDDHFIYALALTIITNKYM